jgi:hypothetical protein
MQGRLIRLTGRTRGTHSHRKRTPGLSSQDAERDTRQERMASMQSYPSATVGAVIGQPFNACNEDSLASGTQASADYFAEMLVRRRDVALESAYRNALPRERYSCWKYATLAYGVNVRSHATVQ